MRSKFVAFSCVGLLCILASNNCSAQIADAGSATFEEATWVANDAMPPVFTCSGEGHDCICSLVAFSGPGAGSGKPHTFTVSVSSQRIVGDKLRMSFASAAGMAGGIPAGITHMEWTQSKEVKMDAAAAAALGYTNIFILPGTYSIKNNSLVVNIRKGKPLPRHGNSTISR